MSLKGHWKLDSNSGLIAYDSSGNGLNGSLINMAGDEWGAGKIGGALNFDGVNDKVVVAPNILLEPTQYSYSFWFKTPNINQHLTYLVETRQGDGYTGFNFYMLNGGLRFQFSVSGTAYITLYGGLIENDTWNYITCTFENGSQKFYLNAVETISSTTAGTPYYGGGKGLAFASGKSTRAFLGTLDDIQFYDNVLTLEEIENIYYSGLKKPIAHFKLDSLSGLVAVDSSGLGHDGALVNMAGDEWTEGKINGALGFDGINDYCSLAGDDTFSSLTEGTISLWVKINSLSDRSGLFGLGSKTDPDTDDFLLIRVNVDGTILVYQKDNTVDRISFATKDSLISIGAWSHIAYTVNSSGNKFYFNGQNIPLIDLNYTKGSPSSPNFFDDISSVTQNYVLGSYKIGGVVYKSCKGIIDDARIYHIVLTAQEILDLYNDASPVIGGVGRAIGSPFVGVGARK